MWNLKIRPRPLTPESLRVIQQNKLSRNLARSQLLIHRIREIIRPNQPNSKFRSGRYLPKYVRLFVTPNMINIPLEDLDPFYANVETFIVVTEAKVLHRFSASPALNIFSPFNPIRKTCIFILHHWIYRWFLIFIAFIDSCLLTQPRSELKWNYIYSFGAIYTFDFVISVTAKGLVCNKFMMLRDGWGILDLILLLPFYLPDIGRYYFVVGIRILKIAALTPSLKSTVEAVLRNVRNMRDIFIWTLLATWILALVGHQLYMGVSTQKCIHDFPEDGSVGVERDMKWHAWVSNSTNWFRSNDQYRTCGYYSLRECPENYTICFQSLESDDSLYGSMGWAIMSTIRLMHQDSWDKIYQKILRTAGPWHVLYFVVTIFLGSFYSLNMILAVVSKSFEELQKELQRAEKLDEIRGRRNRGESSIVPDGNVGEIDETHPESGRPIGTFFKCFDYFCTHPFCKVLTCLRNLIRIIAYNPFTELIMGIAEVIYLILLSMEHFRIEENYELALAMEWGYLIILTLFAVECLLKLMSSSPLTFFKDIWNTFEFTLALLFVVDLIFEEYIDAPRVMKTIRSFYSLRVFKLARIWPTLSSVLSSAFNSMRNVSDMTIVAISTFYIFCVAGVNLFRRDQGDHPPDSHWHFGDFWHSFMVIFRLLCGEWTDTMWECVEYHGHICIPFFISAVIVMDIIVLNLLLVIFLQRFSFSTLTKRNENAKPNHITIVVGLFRRLWKWVKTKLEKCLWRRSNHSQVFPEGSTSQADHDVKDDFQREPGSGRSKIRQKLITIMNHKHFQRVNIGITIVSAIFLSLRDVNLKKRPILQEILYFGEPIITFFLWLEAVIKISALGFSPYFKNKWNQLDFLIILAAGVNEAIYYLGLGHVAFFRSIRMLRLFSNFEGTRNLFNSLGKAMTKIVGVLLVCLLLWLIFAIIGVELFNGTFYKCVNEYGELLDSRVIHNKIECIAYNFTWENSKWNFDNVGSAYYCILQVITFKGWTHVLHDATSSGFSEQQPSFEKNFWLSGYFVILILIGSFFAFNLFVGVLIDGLNEEREKVKKKSDKNLREMIYHDTRRQFKEKFKGAVLTSHKENSQKYVLAVVTSKQFDMFILLSIAFNMLVLSMEHRNPSQPWRTVFTVLNGISTGFLASECLLNMFALRLKYFKGLWNLYDLLTAALSTIDLIWKGVQGTSFLPFSSGLLRLVRICRVSKFLRQFRIATGMRQLVSVFQVSLPAFFNMCVLLFLVMFIYGILGMEFFKNIKLRMLFDIGFNFRTLPQALIVLFQILTSAGWNELLETLSMDTDCVKPDPEMKIEGDCGDPTIAGIFVISYLFITFVILVNMYSAIILENYSQIMQLVECELSLDNFDPFYKIYSQFDPEESHFIASHFLPDIFDRLEPPLRVPFPNQCAIGIMNISIYEDHKVHCLNVLDAAVTYFYFQKGAIKPEAFGQSQQELKDEQDPKHKIITTTLLNRRKIHSVKVLQRAWRKYKESYCSFYLC